MVEILFPKRNFEVVVISRNFGLHFVCVKERSFFHVIALDDFFGFFFQEVLMIFSVFFLNALITTKVRFEVPFLIGSGFQKVSITIFS